MQYEEWEGFVPGKWCDDEVDVRDFIQRNYTPYEGDASFLAPATEATKKLWQIVLDLSAKEREAGGVLDADTKIVSTLTSHGPGYLDKELEKIFRRTSLSSALFSPSAVSACPKRRSICTAIRSIPR